MNLQALYEMRKIEDYLSERKPPSSSVLHEETPTPAEQWGVGDAKDAASFYNGVLNTGESYDLIFGQFPHSKRDNNIYARFEDGDIVGFDGHRPLIGLDFTSYNYRKESDFSGDEIRKGGTANIRVNGDIIYSFFYRQIDHALEEAKRLLVKLSEHSSDVFGSKGLASLIGRKVYYDRTPAIVDVYFPDQGAVVLKASEGHTFQRPVWWEEDDGIWEWTTSMKADLLSPHIWWHRD